jgi:hypothetical protein
MSTKSKLLNGCTLLLAAASLAACSTSGSDRVASIGSTAPVSGDSSTSGSGGSLGSGLGAVGDAVSGATSGVTSSLPVGSITGAGGVAGTGLLANVGQAGQESPLAPVLVTAGNAALDLGQTTGQLTGAVAGAVPAVAPVTDAVTQTLTNTGTALTQAASGQTPLLDGVTQAVAPVVTVAANGTALVGDTAGSSLVAVSAGSPAAGSGSLVNLNLAKDSALSAGGTGTGTGTLPANNLLGVQVGSNSVVPASGTPLVDVKLGSAAAPNGSLLGAGVDSAGQLVSANIPLAAASGVTGATSGTPVGGVLQQATANLTSATGGTGALSTVTTPVKGLVSTLLHH